MSALKYNTTANSSKCKNKKKEMPVPFIVKLVSLSNFFMINSWSLIDITINFDLFCILYVINWYLNVSVELGIDFFLPDKKKECFTEDLFNARQIEKANMSSSKKPHKLLFVFIWRTSNFVLYTCRQVIYVRNLAKAQEFWREICYEPFRFCNVHSVFGIKSRFILPACIHEVLFNT